MKAQPVRLVALGRGRQTYGTRVLTAGEEFEMRRDYADLLIRTGKAKLAGDKPTVSPQQQQVEEKVAAAAETEAEIDMPLLDPRNIDSLRAQAARLGITVDGRWGIARLQHEIMQAQRR
jgi:hypothetical protein